jgi:SAM-dependent methyltransferase
MKSKISLPARARALARHWLRLQPRAVIPAKAQRAPKILHHVKRSGLGVEIGPSYGPLAPKREGFQVHVIDHLDRAGLMDKYRSHGMPVDQIEEVDFVWRGESYAELTGHRQHYDWIIASHLIEHTPDLIGFLLNCAEILKDDGVLSLAIPDARYCFDHFRSPSSVASAIDAHLARRVRPSPGTVAEHHLSAVARAGRIAWSARDRGIYSFVHTHAEARATMEKACDTEAYLDVHVWCFTPHSFRLMIQDLYELGLQPFRECSFFPTAGCEFYVTLGRQGSGPGLDRLALLKKARREFAAA